MNLKQVKFVMLTDGLQKAFCLVQFLPYTQVPSSIGEVDVKWQPAPIIQSLPIDKFRPTKP